MQWLVKSVSSNFSKDLSHEAKDSTLKAKTKDFKIVLEEEDLSSRTPTLVNINNVYPQLYTTHAFSLFENAFIALSIEPRVRLSLVTSNISLSSAIIFGLGRDVRLYR